MPPVVGPLSLPAWLRTLRLPARRRVLPALWVVLAGFGAAAVAVAPLALDAPLPPQRLVAAEVAGTDDLRALQAWREQALQLHRDTLTRPGDTPANVLRRLGVLDASTVAALQELEVLAQALRGARHLVRGTLADDGRLRLLEVLSPTGDGDAPTLYQHLRLEPDRPSGGWAWRLERLPLTVETRSAGLELRGDWRRDVAAAELPPAVASQVLALCAAPQGKECELGAGSRLAVVYETVRAGDLPAPWNDGVGRVLAARFGSGPGAQQAVWFAADGQGGAYYDARGRAQDSGFLASPVPHDRITSGFATRIDPFKRREAEHRGVDYSAPTGTPVHSVADGVVEFAGRQSGYGNVVEVRHGADRTTLYAHLSRIDVAPDDRVQRGQVIGAVGATGWATGPHLHFEYRVAGVHQDPQFAAGLNGAAPLQLPARARARFDAHWRQLGASLDHALAQATPRSRIE